MIFQHTLDLLLSRQKWQTRRIIKPNEIAIRGKSNRITAVALNGREKWCVGKTYAVQAGRGQLQVARICITRIRSEYVTRIHTADAIAEGFQSRQHFLTLWQQIHGREALQARVWIIEFALLSAINDEKPVLKPAQLRLPESYVNA